MDYKIKFEAKGIGKKATDIRQKVISQQKANQAKTGINQQSSINKNQTIVINKLNDSINKLISSNKEAILLKL